ncbi:MAG: hypothetical protein KME52_11955 [Desmonostoc geniculatum HA4340-LM1]|jgi:hypothetical protein|nr:hypothetical protein [Desmonostoc geniculatum HA4340-LM1]
MPKKQGDKSNKPNSLLRILYWGLVAAAIWFAYLNIQPYEKVVALLSGKAVNGAFGYLISVIPIVNGIAAIIGKGITWILGTILWGIIQIIEVLPLILYSNEKFVQTVISSADSRSQYHLKENDDPTLKMLKKAYNKLPTSVISNLEILKVFTYTIDFLICITVYSPVASGKFSDFFFILATGQWGKLDYGNLALAFVTLFAIEVIISLIIWVGKLSYAIQESSKN